jgi:protein gp37
VSGKTKIAWATDVWNVLRGCSKVSAGCKNCYAEKMAARFCAPEIPVKGGGARPGPYHGFITDGRWNSKVRLVEKALDQPLRWTKPRRVFVNSMSDLFHEAVPFETIAAIFGVMAASPQHTFQCLTKRADRMLEFFDWAATGGRLSPGEPIKLLRRAVMDMLPGAGTAAWERLMQPVTDCPDAWPLPNVWLGVSCEDQAAADERIPLLLRCPAAIRWVSYEPALGSIDFSQDLPRCHGCGNTPCECEDFGDALDWIVVGGESQAGARPFDLEWARSTVAQCKAAGVPCFVKQMGSKPFGDPSVGFKMLDGGHASALDDRAGTDPSEWPEDLRVREYPGAS